MMDAPIPIEITTVGYRGQFAVAGYGAVLTMGDIQFESAKPLGEFTKHQADIISITMALRCVKQSYRDGPVVLNVPSSYALRMIERRSDGAWMAHPSANADMVREARQMIDLFPNIEFRSKVNHYNDKFVKRCIDLAKKCLQSDN